jgi:hypothetical protein
LPFDLLLGFETKSNGKTQKAKRKTKPNTMRKYPKPSQKAEHSFDFCLLRFAF